MQQNMDQLWHSFSSGGGEWQDVENWAIPLDVVQEGDNIVVKASVPGVKPEDIDVSIENDVLTITVDSDNAQPHYEHGVLSITFPKMESKRAKRLQISSGQGSQGQIIEGQRSPEQPSSGS